MNDDQLFLDGEAEPAATPRPTPRRAGAVVAVVVALLAAGGVAAGLVVAGGSAKGHDDAVRTVVSALSATTDSGSFSVSYQLSSTPATETPATSSTTSTTQAAVPCIANGAESECAAEPNPDQVPVSVTGSGTIDTSPKASVVSAVLSPQGGISQLTLRVDSTDVYEDLGSLDTSLTPPAEMANAPGQAMPGFAPVTEQVLGPREGAVAMLGIASPDGYLNLAQAAITGASETGTSTLDGVPVTQYRVSDDPSQLVGSSTLSPAESQSVSDAVRVLDDHGYTDSSVDLAIDAAGFIRSVSSVTHFSDGSTVVLAATLSDFGCAGTVLMPGQTGTGVPPADCTSPDTGPAATTTTTGSSSGGTPTTIACQSAGSTTTIAPGAAPTGGITGSTGTTGAPSHAVTVEVANGTSIAGVSAYYAQLLQAKGWQTLVPVLTVTPTTASDVYYATGEQNDADTIAGELGLPGSAVLPLTSSVPVSIEGHVDVVVVAGPDLAGKVSPTTTTAGTTGSSGTGLSTGSPPSSSTTTTTTPCQAAEPSSTSGTANEGQPTT